MFLSYRNSKILLAGILSATLVSGFVISTTASAATSPVIKVTPAKALKNGQVLRGISRILGHIATVGAGPLREGLPRVLVHLCQIRRQRTIPAWRGGNV